MVKQDLLVHHSRVIKVKRGIVGPLLLFTLKERVQHEFLYIWCKCHQFVVGYFIARDTGFGAKAVYVAENEIPLNEDLEKSKPALNVFLCFYFFQLGATRKVRLNIFASDF